MSWRQTKHMHATAVRYVLMLQELADKARLSSCLQEGVLDSLDVLGTYLQGMPTLHQQHQQQMARTEGQDTAFGKVRVQVMPAAPAACTAVCCAARWLPGCQQELPAVSDCYRMLLDSSCPLLARHNSLSQAVVMKACCLLCTANN